MSFKNFVLKEFKSTNWIIFFLSIIIGYIGLYFYNSQLFNIANLLISIPIFRLYIVILYNFIKPYNKNSIENIIWQTFLVFFITISILEYLFFKDTKIIFTPTILGTIAFIIYIILIYLSKYIKNSIVLTKNNYINKLEKKLLKNKEAYFIIIISFSIFSLIIGLLFLIIYKNIYFENISAIFKNISKFSKQEIFLLIYLPIFLFIFFIRSIQQYFRIKISYIVLISFFSILLYLISYSLRKNTINDDLNLLNISSIIILPIFVIICLIIILSKEKSDKLTKFNKYLSGLFKITSIFIFIFGLIVYIVTHQFKRTIIINYSYIFQNSKITDSENIPSMICDIKKQNNKKQNNKKQNIPKLFYNNELEIAKPILLSSTSTLGNNNLLQVGYYFQFDEIIPNSSGNHQGLKEVIYSNKLPEKYKNYNIIGSGTTTLLVGNGTNITLIGKITFLDYFKRNITINGKDTNIEKKILYKIDKKKYQIKLYKKSGKYFLWIDPENNIKLGGKWQIKLDNTTYKPNIVYNWIKRGLENNKFLLKLNKGVINKADCKVVKTEEYIEKYGNNFMENIKWKLALFLIYFWFISILIGINIYLLKNI